MNAVSAVIRSRPARLPAWALLLSLALVLAASAAGKVRLYGAEVGHWTMDYDSALKLAKEKNLPLFLNFTGSDWCSWCQLLDEKIFSHPGWNAYARTRLVLVTLDFPRNEDLVPAKYRARNEKLHQDFAIPGFPTLLVMDADGKTMLGQMGAGEDPKITDFLAELRGILRLRPVEIERAAAAMKPEAGQSYRDAGKAYWDAVKDLDAWLQTRPLRTDANTKRYEQMVDRILNARSKLAKLAPPEP